MEKTPEVVLLPFFNLDYIYYLIYSFFKTIKDFFIPTKDAETGINLVDIWKYSTDNQYVSDTEKYSKFGDGIASWNEGYSLFTPPHGLSEFGGLSNWFKNFFINPYCQDCPSFSDLFFGGINLYFYIFIFFGIFILFFLNIKKKKLSEKENVLYDTVYQKGVVEKSNQKSEKWENILKLTKSLNVNDWKAAIFDADNLLEEVLKENNFGGENIGEMLKNANFDTLQNAWEGHKVRNKIAHDSVYILTHRETKKAISNFGIVFSEFYNL